MKGVVLILGEERFLAREALEGVAARDSDLETSRCAGDEIEAAALLDELRTPSMFGPGRCVVVRDAGKLLQGEALHAVAAYAAAPAPGALLVLQTPKLDGRLAGTKKLKAAAEVIACDPPPDRAVPDWIARRGKQAHGLQIPRPAAQALKARVGEDLGLLDAALARLRAQIAPRVRLDPRDVVGSTEEQRSPVLFEVGNALEEGNLPAALAALRAAFGEGIRIRQDLVHEPRAIAPILLANLHGTYVKLLRFQMLRRGLDDQDAAVQAGVSPRAARFFVERARRHRLDRLAARHEHFLEADRAVKRSGEEPRRVMEHLLVSLLA